MITLIASIALADDTATLTEAERKDCRNAVVPAASISKCMTAKSVGAATAAGHPTTTAQTTNAQVTTANIYPYAYGNVGPAGYLYSGYFTPGVVPQGYVDPAAAALYIVNERQQWRAIDTLSAELNTTNGNIQSLWRVSSEHATEIYNPTPSSDE